MSKITIPDNSILLLEGGSLRGLFTAGVLGIPLWRTTSISRQWPESLPGH